MGSVSGGGVLVESADGCSGQVEVVCDDDEQQGETHADDVSQGAGGNDEASSEREGSGGVGCSAGRSTSGAVPGMASSGDMMVDMLESARNSRTETATELVVRQGRARSALEAPVDDMEWRRFEHARRLQKASDMEKGFLRLKQVAMKVHLRRRTALAVSKVKDEYEQWVTDNEVGL